MPRPRTTLNPDLIGALEAASILGVSRATILRRARNGDIPATRQLPGLTAAYLFDRTVIEKLARNGKAA